MLAPFSGLYCWHYGGPTPNLDSNSEAEKYWSGVGLISGKKAEGQGSRTWQQGGGVGVEDQVDGPFLAVVKKSLKVGNSL